MKRYLLSFLLLQALSAYPQSGPPKDMDAYAEKVLKTFDVPGMAVAIVKDGKMVWAKGYGVRQSGHADKVDTHTLFGIASNTKVFTATALGLLVEEGKLAWDAPVINYLPWFQLSNPYVTSELTIRDLLVHRSGLGLGSGDLLWWPASDYSRKDIARKLKYLPLVTSFRSAYAYDNVLYLVAGEVIEAVSGQSWEQFITSRIMSKVGMNESTVAYTLAGNVAYPHAVINDKVQPVAAFASTNTNPAGGINSNVEDMAKWMIVQMDSGRIGKTERLFSGRTTRELWTIVTPTPINDPPAELAPLKATFSGYALGLGIRDYRGKKVVTHTGGLPGYVSKVAMIPELKMGVVILTNQEVGPAFEAVAYHVMDHYLGAPEYDWVGNYKKVLDRGRASVLKSDNDASAARDAKSTPSLPLNSYAGTYTDDWYGDIVITASAGGLEINFTHTPLLKGKLEHWQHDTFVARWNDRELRADAFITFSLTPQGTIDRAKMQAFSPSTDFSFDFQDLTLKPKK